MVLRSPSFCWDEPKECLLNLFLSRSKLMSSDFCFFGYSVSMNSLKSMLYVMDARCTSLLFSICSQLGLSSYLTISMLLIKRFKSLE